MQSRKTRSDESRGLDIREIKDFEKILKMKSICTFHIDEGLVPEGYQYAFKRVEYAGNVDYNNYSEALRMKWSPVPRERHPHLMEGILLREDSPWKDYIVKGGQILMERKKEYCDMEKKYYQKKSLELVTSIPGSDKLSSESAMPMVVYQNQTELNGIAPFQFSE